MTRKSNTVVRRIFNTRDEHISDLTASFYELEPYDSIVHALEWKQMKRRLPICWNKTWRNRFMLPNMMYLGYAIALLIIDFNEYFNPPQNSTSVESMIKISNNSKSIASLLDQPVQNDPLTNKLYIVLAILSIVAGLLYCWAWQGRSFFDIVMIPEYFNLIQSLLYLWTASWYSKQDTLGGYYTMTIHRIELIASIIGLLAAIGWVVSWYMTYTRILGRGYTFDDPDVMSCIAIVVNALIYIVYNVQLNVAPQDYETNMLYKFGDIVGFIEACFCVFACLRDDNWFWFLPLAGQYGIALGRVQVETKILPQFGKSPVILNKLCRKKEETKTYQKYDPMNNVRHDIITVPIFTSPTHQSFLSES